MKVVNDIVERGVKLNEDYNKLPIMNKRSNIYYKLYEIIGGGFRTNLRYDRPIGELPL